MTTLVNKLVNIQGRLKAPKNQRNNFGKYNYRSCEDILEAVKPLLAEQGLVLTITADVIGIYAWTPSKSDFYYRPQHAVSSKKFSSLLLDFLALPWVSENNGRLSKFIYFFKVNFGNLKEYELK